MVSKHRGVELKMRDLCLNSDPDTYDRQGSHTKPNDPDVGCIQICLRNGVLDMDLSARD